MISESEARELVHQTLRQEAYWMVNKQISLSLGFEAAVILSDLISKANYFEIRGQLDKEGYFFNTQENMKVDMGLSPYQQRMAIEALVNSGILLTKKYGMPLQRYFKINYVLMLKFLTSGVKKLDGNKNKEINTLKGIIEPPDGGSLEKSENKKKTHPIIEYWNTLEGTRKHLNPETKTYQATIKDIKKLQKGLFFKMRTLKLEQLKNLSQADKNKKWTEPEIKTVLERMTNIFKDGYWPTDKSQVPASLNQLIYNPRTQYSWFIHCWKFPPVPISKEKKIKILDEEVFEMYKDILGPSEKMMDKFTIVINDLYRWYQNKLELIGPLYDTYTFKSHFGTFKRFAENHIKWLEKQGELHIAYCKHDGVNFNRFLNFVKETHSFNFTLTKKDKEVTRLLQLVDIQSQKIEADIKARELAKEKRKAQEM